MNDPDAEFVYRTAIGNSGSDISEAVIRKKDDSNGRNFIPTTKPIETVVKIAKPDSESENDGDDVPLRYVVAKKKILFRNGINVFQKPKLNKFSLAEKGIVTINLGNPSPFQVFTEMISLDVLLIIIKIESERYAALNGGICQTTNYKLLAIPGKNILMRISCLPAIKGNGL